MLALVFDFMASSIGMQIWLQYPGMLQSTPAVHLCLPACSEAAAMVSEAELTAVRQHMRTVKPPSHYDKVTTYACAASHCPACIVIGNSQHCLVLPGTRGAAASAEVGAAVQVYKEECMFSFDTPLSPGGLYVNLNSWQAFGEEFVQLDAQRSGQALYLLQRFQKVRGPACMILFRGSCSIIRGLRLQPGMHRLHLPKPCFRTQLSHLLSRSGSGAGRSATAIALSAICPPSSCAEAPQSPQLEVIGRLDV